MTMACIVTFACFEPCVKVLQGAETAFVICHVKGVSG